VRAEVVFSAVATPTTAAGHVDLRYVRSAAQAIGVHLGGHSIIVNKSTGPIGTGDWVGAMLRRTAPPDVSVAVVSNPEFLAEGSAVSNFLAPDRVVLGGDDHGAAEAVAGLYLGLETPIIIADLCTAEMIKYARNAMLATHVSFINEIAANCARLGADVRLVAKGMGYDRRIGKAFLWRDVWQSA
jgi:UDPglucose 6-dehydrogenase